MAKETQGNRRLLEQMDMIYVIQVYRKIRNLKQKWRSETPFHDHVGGISKGMKPRKIPSPGSQLAVKYAWIGQ